MDDKNCVCFETPAMPQHLRGHGLHFHELLLVMVVSKTQAEKIHGKCVTFRKRHIIVPERPGNKSQFKQINVAAINTSKSSKNVDSSVPTAESSTETASQDI